MGLWTVQVALLRHDDVLNVFHSEVVAERVVEQSLELVHSQFLHVALGDTENNRDVLISRVKSFCLNSPQRYVQFAGQQ